MTPSRRFVLLDMWSVENQGHVFPDYDHMNCDATAVCERLGIPFTDDLYLEYPAERTFDPSMKLKLTLRKKNSALNYPLTTNGFLLNLASSIYQERQLFVSSVQFAQCTRHKEPGRLMRI